jgi:hypothetical protein
MAMLRPMLVSLWWRAACYAHRIGASRMARKPAFCPIRPPLCPCADATRARWNASMESSSGDHAMPSIPTQDPNAELRHFEPLRVALALGALLLGLVMGIH